MRRHTTVIANLVLVLALVGLAACEALPAPVLVPASTETPFPNTPCAACAQATQIAAVTQANINANARQAQDTATADILNSQALATANAGTATQSAALAEDEIGAIALQAQAAATADILRAHALATFNAASSTQGVALTQDSLDASALQAEVAATANVLRAEALATFNAAGATQSSALTQAALEQTQVQRRQQQAAQSATHGAAATRTQQWLGGLVAGTATRLARGMTDQTQSAAAFAQQAADQRQAQNQGPLIFLWKWGLPLFIAAAALLGLWGFARWLKLHTSRPRAAGLPAGGLLVIRGPGRRPAEYLPNTLRWMAWFLETRSRAPAPPGPPSGAVVIDNSPNSPVAAAPPWRDPAIEITPPPTPGVSEAALPARPDHTKV